MKPMNKWAVKFKPPVAFQKEAEARANVELKIEFLQSVVGRTANNLAVKDLTDEKLLALLKTLPNSKNTFNGLSTDGLVNELRAGAPIFRSNAPITLRRDQVLTARVEKLLRAISDAINKISQPPEKTIKVASLARQLKLSNTLREIAEETIYAQKRQIEKLRNDVVSFQNKLESLRRASEESASRLRLEIKLLKQEAPREAAISNKVVSLPTRPMRK